LHDPLNRYLYHPLAARLARLLLPTGISPNAVSVVGGLCIWVAAAAYAGLAWPSAAAVGLFFHMLWHVVDGADGDLARLSGKSSPRGEMIDGLCDYAGHAALYLVFAAMLDDEIGWWAWPLGLLAAASHAVQTNHAETQKRSYMWWVYGVPWLKQAQAGEGSLREQTGSNAAFTGLVQLYLKVATEMSRGTARLDALVAEAADDPARLNAIRNLVRSKSKAALVMQKLLGPNYRTLLGGLSIALGSPLWFFLAEVLLLNALLLVSVRQHNAWGRQVVARLG
jgi:phosphatidylglycerophosphate synthase